MRKSWHNKDEVGLSDIGTGIKTIDDLVDEALEQVDGEKHLSENLTYLRQNKYFREAEAEIQERAEKDVENHQEQLKDELIKSLFPVYQCRHCQTIFENQQSLVEHFKEHGVVDIHPPTEPCVEYVLLKHLVEVAVKIPRAKHFTITCAELHAVLLRQFDNLSNQTPTHTLKHLGLFKGRSKMAWDGNGNRIYRIHINDLKQVVRESEFDDLKLALIDTIKRVYPKPPRPSNGENDTKDLSTGKTGGFDVNLEF